jgi:hypothetical protein
MRTLPNEKLTLNFTLYEFIESQLPFQGVQMNWANISDFRKDRAKRLCELMETKRTLINNVFRQKNGGKEIGLRFTSAFRSVEWERFRGRSGDSQHTQSWGGDVQPTNVSDELAVQILEYLYSIDNDRATGHLGGFAIKKPEYKNGKIIKIGFLHYDLRGTVARWTY